MDIINIIETSTIVNTGVSNNVIVEIPSSNIILAGTPGPRGPSGESTIAGSPIVISNLVGNDLLAFNGLTWINLPAQDVGDGGNF